MEVTIAAVLLGKIQLEALPYFCYHPGKSMPPCPYACLLSQQTQYIQSCGSIHWVIAVKSFVCHQQHQLWECIGKLWEPYWVYQRLMHRPWKRQEPRGSVEQGSRHTHSSTTPQASSCRVFSSRFLTTKSQHRRRDCLAKVRLHGHSLAVQGQGEEGDGPFRFFREKHLDLCSHQDLT